LQSLERSFGGGWQETAVPGSDDPLLRWGGGTGQEISLEVEFLGRQRATAFRMAQAAQETGWRNEGAPPTWNFVLGRRVIPVKILSIRLTEEQLDREGQPRYVKAFLTLKKFRQFTVRAR
jgi:hypothetical protein